jgi:flagellar protein FlgJ
MDAGLIDTTNYLDPAMASRLRQGVKSGGDKSTLAVARQFESMMLQMMLKSMRDAVPQSGFLSSSATDTYKDLYDKEIAQQISKRGIGLADMIVRQMNKATPPPAQTADGTTPGSGTASADSGLPLVKPSSPMSLAAPARTLQMPREVTDGLSLRLRLQPGKPDAADTVKESIGDE